MTQDTLFTGAEARERIMVGVKKASEAVGGTMGTGGYNSLIEALESPGHFSTNDGITILASMRFADPVEEIGRRVLFEAVNRANRASGDGSSTTCVLTSAILEEGSKLKVNPMELKRSLEDCIPIIQRSIESERKEIVKKGKVDLELLEQVATISAEDETIGKKITEIYSKIGKDGIIDWDVSKTAEDSYTIGKGLTVHGATYASPYMCDIDESGRLLNGIKWKDANVLLVKGKITSATDFNDLFQALFAKGERELVIFCEDIEVPVVADLIRTRVARHFKSCVVKMPVLWRDEWWEDLALASGGTVIDSTVGLHLSKAETKHLGKFGNITVNKEDTHVDGIQDISLHVKALQEEGSDKSLIRASRLNLQTARYFVGGHSESAIAYRRLKVEDSINASREALHEGIVSGGGLALLNASTKLPNTAGGNVLREALKAPFIQILKNVGQKFTTRYGGKVGLDTRTMKSVDMMKSGIVDPASVVFNAVKNAIGVSASILTCGTVIVLPREELQQVQNNARISQ